MADIVISGRKSLATINREFQAQFPYLCLYFYAKAEWDKAQSGVAPSLLDPSPRVAAVRVTKPSTDEKELSIHGRTLVKNLEKNFLKLYGVCVQVGFNLRGNRHYTLGEEYDSVSLSQLNARFESEGAQKNPK